ncbi:MAG TPA: hypothetical protein VGM41_19965 [Chitinophagaceae bacterium]|jgi:hypothetical protein
MYLKFIRKHWIAGLVIPLFLVSCRVLLIGAYDQVTDQSIQKIQTDVATLLVKIERNFDNNTPADNKYENFKPGYESISGEIESLKIRCNSLPKYKFVAAQVNALDSTLTDLEKFHKLGFDSKQEVELVKKTFESEFSSMIALQNGLKREKN